MKTSYFKYVSLIGYILFVNINIYSQELLASFTINTDDEAELVKINTNEDAVMFFDCLSNKDSLILYKIDGNNMDVLKIKNVSVSDGQQVYYSSPYSMFYTKDTLFVTFGEYCAMYASKDMKLSKIIPLIDTVDGIDGYYSIVGYRDKKLILADDLYYHKGLKDYTKCNLVCVDVEKESITDRKTIDFGNAILLNTRSNINIFCSDTKYISVMHTIKPIVYILDYNLDIIDSILFNKTVGYRQSEIMLDSVFNEDLIQDCINSPKTSIYILNEKFDIYNKGYNLKQCFLGNNQLIVYKPFDSSLFNIVCVNIDTKEIQNIASFKEDDILAAIHDMKVFPLFKNGILFKQNERLCNNEEDIIYSIDMYYVKQLDVCR